MSQNLSVLSLRRPRAAVTAIILTLILSAVVPIASVSAAPVTAGFKDHTYGTGVVAPTEDKPQSKVWYTDGSWWGGLFVDGPDEYRIHRYNASTHVWTDTGVVLDQRNSSHGDYLWDAATNTLYVASVNGDTDVAPILVFKLNYNPSTDTYTHDSAFTSAGVVVGTGPAETVTIAKDSTGQLWVTFQNDSIPGDTTSPVDIMVNRSLETQDVWGVPFSIGQAGADDISAIIAFAGNKVGVMWSDQNPSGMQTFFYFSTHDDSALDETWSTKQTSASGPDDFSEDHINLKLVATNSGQVLAAVKTNGGPDHIQLLSRNASTGAWSKSVVVGLGQDGGGQDVTRPQVVVDETNARAYVFYTSPTLTDAGAQSIYYKSAPLSTLSFTTVGLGTLFIQDGTNDINDVSTSKQNVTSASGLLAIASSDTNNFYYHGFLSLGSGGREVVRVSGPNRYATAAEISKVRFPSPASNIEVFVATGANFPDALAAGPAANLKGGPILLVTRDTIPNETKAELTRLGPAKITIVGGTTQVSAAVQALLAAYTDSKSVGSVVRLAGANRNDTAAKVSGLFAADRPAVFIATGAGFPDALSAGPAASLLNVPILLVTQGSIPNETKTALSRLTPATIYVVGGTAVVSDAVKAQLAAYTDPKTAGSVVRLSGNSTTGNRFDTNVAVVSKFWTSTVARSAVANGLNFPDALAEGAYELPLHLVQPTSVPTVVANDIKRINPARIDALGGVTQISDGVLNTLRAL
ncbi:MAG: cell wall-binding repeat-containing protein [Candidatus Limnocylindria bacterium]